MTNKQLSRTAWYTVVNMESEIEGKQVPADV